MKYFSILMVVSLLCISGISMPSQAAVIDSGQRSLLNGVTAGGNWANGFVIQWSITDEGSLGYTYTYTFTDGSGNNLVGQPSHLIFEVSQNAPNAIFMVGETVLEPQYWGAGSGNPGLATNIWGIKLDFASDSYTFETTQAPMWGDFYTKDGRAGGFGQNYAFNTGIGTEPIGDDFTNWIRVPDTFTTVPEPGTMLLLGSGLVGLAGWGRKKFRI